MKLNFKKIGVEAEADVEKIVEKKMELDEKDWQQKHNAKMEKMELKHKHKMEEKEFKKKNSKEYLKLEQEQELKEQNTKNMMKVFSIIVFFIYGLFCITGFKDSHTIAAIISLFQVILVSISIFSLFDIIKLFKNDDKLCLIISFFLIIPWLFFAV